MADLKGSNKLLISIQKLMKKKSVFADLQRFKNKNPTFITSKFKDLQYVEEYRKCIIYMSDNWRGNFFSHSNF